MVDWKAVIIGFILTIVLGLLLGIFVGNIASSIGFLIATIVTSYLAGGGPSNGALHGALTAILGGIIVAIIAALIGSTLITITAGAGTWNCHWCHCHHNRYCRIHNSRCYRRIIKPGPRRNTCRIKQDFIIFFINCFPFFKKLI